MIDKELINELKSLDVWKTIYYKFTPMFAYITGSQSYDITDEQSDYDINIIIKEQTQNDPREWLLYKDKLKIHWHYICYDDLINGAITTPMTALRCMQLHYLTEEQCIELDDKIAFDAVLNCRGQLSYKGIVALYGYYANMIDSIIMRQVITRKTKMLYHLCHAYYLLTEQPVDKEFLSMLKRIAWKSITQECEAQCIDILEKLDNLLGANNVKQSLNSTKS